MALSPYDPHQVIRPGRLAPHGEGVERIAFGAPDCDVVPTSMCVDLAGIVSTGARPSGAVGLLDRGPPRAGAPTNDARTICFDEREGAAP